MRPNLSVNIGKLKLKNPVMVASGTFGYAEEFADFIELKKLGAIVTKTITLKPRPGNPPARTCETPSGMLNSIGLENPGIDAFISDKLPQLAAYKVPLIVSVASEEDVREFSLLVKKLDKIREVAAIELNISCPNVRHGRRRGLIAQDAAVSALAVKAARRATGKTLITKLSPNVTDIALIAKAAEKAGSDAVSLINTLVGMSIDPQTRKPRLASGTGGLSGPAVRPVAVRMVWEAHQKIKIPIIGMGGIIDTQSALEFILAGASAVAVGTANFIEPAITLKIIEGIRDYLRQNRTSRVRDLIGGINK